MTDDEEIDRILKGYEVCSVKSCNNRPILGQICCRSCKSRLVAKYDGNTNYDPRVYFIMGTGTEKIKIGYSSNINNRLMELQIGSPVKLLIIGSFVGDIYDEQALHGYFDKYRARGEWFHLSDEIIDAIEIANNKGIEGIRELINS